MIIRELVERLGLEVDETAYAKGEAAMESLRLGAAAFAGAIVAGFAVAAAAVVNATANAGDAAGKLAQKTGLPIETIQELGYAAELADVSVDTLAHGLQHLARTGVRDVRGEVLRLSDRMRAMPDDGAKVALAMTKLGKAGADLIPILNRGSEELGLLMDEAHAMGMVFSKEDAAAAEELNDGIKRLNLGIKGAAYSIGKLMLPYAQRFVIALRMQVVAFIAFAERLRKDTKLREEILGWVKALGLALASAAIAKGIMLIAAAFGSLSGVSIGALLKSLFSPFAILTTVVGLLALGLEDLYTYLEGGDSVIGEFADAFRKRFGKDLGPEIQSFASGIQTAFSGLARVLGTVVDGFTAIRDLFREIKQTGLHETVNGLGRYLAVKLVGEHAPGQPIPEDISRRLNAPFGGGSSPAAAAALTAPLAPAPKAISVNAPASITVHVGAGTNPQEVAGALVDALEEHWHNKVRAAIAGVD